MLHLAIIESVLEIFSGAMLIKIDAGTGTWGQKSRRSEQHSYTKMHFGSCTRSPGMLSSTSNGIPSIYRYGKSRGVVCRCIDVSQLFRPGRSQFSTADWRGIRASIDTMIGIEESVRHGTAQMYVNFSVGRYHQEIVSEVQILYRIVSIH